MPFDVIMDLSNQIEKIGDRFESSFKKEAHHQCEKNALWKKLLR